MTYQQFEHILAVITLAMPAVLGLAHSLLYVAKALDARAKATKSDVDDKVTRRLVIAATWFDAIAKAIAHAASMGFFLRETETTPGLERAEQDERDAGGAR